MTERPAVSQINTGFIPTHSSSSSDSNVNPFETPIAYCFDDSTTSLPSRPQRAALSTAPQHQRMESKRSSRSDSRVDPDGLATQEEKWSHIRQQSSSARSSRHIHDAEKQTYTSPRNSRPFVISEDALSAARSRDSLNEIDTMQARKAVNILLYLSGPCLLLSFVTMVWAIASLLITILYQPFRLCTPRLPFRHQICHLLAPTLNLHLRCIYAQVYPRPTEEDEVYSATWLMLVHLLGPVVSLGNAVAAWVVALYWCLARIVGDPGGMDKKDDGVEAVLGLTHFWENMLMRSVKLREA